MSLHPGLHDAALICPDAVRRWANRVDPEAGYEERIAKLRDTENALAANLEDDVPFVCMKCGARHKQDLSQCCAKDCRKRHCLDNVEALAKAAAKKEAARVRRVEVEQAKRAKVEKAEAAVEQAKRARAENPADEALTENLVRALTGLSLVRGW